MSEYDVGAVVLAFAAYFFGTWIGGRNERARHKDDLPQWKACLGDCLWDQVQEVRKYEKFAAMPSRHSCVMCVEDSEYIVSVQSAPSDFEEYDEDEDED